jgi:putative transposase
MVAFAVHESGRREVIGIEIAEAETKAGRSAFLRELRAHGLQGVRLCVADDHLGLKGPGRQGPRVPRQRLHRALHLCQTYDLSAGKLTTRARDL